MACIWYHQIQVRTTALVKQTPMSFTLWRSFILALLIILFANSWLCAFFLFFSSLCLFFLVAPSRTRSRITNTRQRKKAKIPAHGVNGNCWLPSEMSEMPKPNYSPIPKAWEMVNVSGSGRPRVQGDKSTKAGRDMICPPSLALQKWAAGAVS